MKVFISKSDILDFEVENNLKKEKFEDNSSDLIDNLVKTITDYEVQWAGMDNKDPMRKAYKGIISSLKDQLKNLLVAKSTVSTKEHTKSHIESNLRGTKVSFNSGGQYSLTSKFDLKKVWKDSEKNSEIIELISSDFSSDVVSIFG